MNKLFVSCKNNVWFSWKDLWENACLCVSWYIFFNEMPFHPILVDRAIVIGLRYTNLTFHNFSKIFTSDIWHRTENWTVDVHVNTMHNGNLRGQIWTFLILKLEVRWVLHNWGKTEAFRCFFTEYKSIEIWLRYKHFSDFSK